MTVLNRSFKAESDRVRVLVKTMRAATLNRDSFMLWPFLKEGVVYRERKVSTAKPRLHSKYRRRPGFMGGNEQNVLQSVPELAPRDRHQLEEPVEEPRIGLAGGQPIQLKTRRPEHVSREPTRATPLVVPQVLENVGHLQSLGVCHRQCQKTLSLLVDFGGVVAEQPR